MNSPKIILLPDYSKDSNYYKCREENCDNLIMTGDYCCDECYTKATGLNP